MDRVYVCNDASADRTREKVEEFMGVDKTYLIFYPVALLGTLFITYLLVRVLSRIPHSELLIGRN